MNYVASRAWIALIASIMFAGCDLIEPPTPKPGAGIGRSTSATPNAASPGKSVKGGPKIWRKQTCGGLSFEAPFEVKLDPTLESKLSADSKIGMTNIQGFIGYSEENESLRGVRLQVVKFNGNPAFSANIEQALHKSFQNAARKHGDPNPQYTVLWAQFGAATGYRLTYAKTDARDPRVIEAIVAAADGTYWKLDLESANLAQRDTIKKIVDSITIQP
jgi:hypothetical protein